MSKYMLLMQGALPPMKVPLRAVKNVYNFKYGITSYKMSAAWERYLTYLCYFEKRQFKEEVAHYIGGTVNMVFLEDALRIFESRHPMTETPGLTYENIPCFADKDSGVEIVSYKQNYIITLEQEKALLNIIKEYPYRTVVSKIELKLLNIFGDSLKGGTDNAAINFLKQHGVNTIFLPEKPVEIKKKSRFAPDPVSTGIVILGMLFFAGFALMNSGKTVLTILGFILIIIFVNIWDSSKR